MALPPPEFKLPDPAAAPIDHIISFISHDGLGQPECVLRRTRDVHCSWGELQGGAHVHHTTLLH